MSSICLQLRYTSHISYIYIYRVDTWCMHIPYTLYAQLGFPCVGLSSENPPKKPVHPPREVFAAAPWATFHLLELNLQVNWIFTCNLWIASMVGVYPPKIVVFSRFSKHESFRGSQAASGYRVTRHHLLCLYPNCWWCLKIIIYNSALSNVSLFVKDTCILQELSSKLIGSGSSETSADDGSRWVWVKQMSGLFVRRKQGTDPFSAILLTWNEKWTKRI